MVIYIRNIEKGLLEKKKFHQVKKRNLKYARKSIFARQLIQKGEKLTKKNLVIKRPSIGLSPIYWNRIIKQRAIKKYLKDEKISKKICIITSSRADYGLLRNLIRSYITLKKLNYIYQSLEHICFKHGYTLKEILKDKTLVNSGWIF